MDWFKYQRTLIDNPKTKKLARLLDMQPVHVVGHLLALWSWAIDYAQDGDITPFCAEEIADAARYDGDAQKFLDALINCGLRSGGFIDRTEDGGLVFHDWEDNIGSEFEKRAKDAERKRESRAKKKQPQTNNAVCPQDVRETSAGRPMPVRRERKGEEREEKRREETTPPTPPQGERQQAEELPSDAATVTRVIKAWNDQLGGYGFPEASKTTPRRERAFDARLNERRERKSLSWWQDVFRQIAASKFMRDEASRKAGWLCFDWILKEDNLVKICEGKYDDRDAPERDPHKALREAQTYEEAAAAYYASL